MGCECRRVGGGGGGERWVGVGEGGVGGRLGEGGKEDGIGVWGREVGGRGSGGLGLWA